MIYKRKRKLFSFLKNIFLLLFIIALFFNVFIIFKNLVLIDTLKNENFKLDKPISILLTGTDYSSKRAKTGDGARSDTIMVATLNKKNSRGNIETNLVSIPRDTVARNYCSGDGTTYSKITDTTNYGFSKNQNLKEGIECTKKSVENLLNIKIDYYISTGFDGVIDVINNVGGIDVNVPYDFCEQNEKDQGGSADSQVCGNGAYYFKKGNMHLNGKQALSYSRQRHASSDYDRNIRQQQVILAVIKKIMNNPSKYQIGFIQTFFQDFQTNLDENSVRKLFNFGITTFNETSNKVSKNIPVIVDIKQSPFQNETQTGNATTGDTDDNVNTKNISSYYSNDSIQDFETDTEIKRYIFNKDTLNISSSNAKISDNKAVHIELSMFSMAAVDNPNKNLGSSSYPSYSTLYYTSNLLRNSLNQSTTDPVFDYNAAGLPETSDY